MAGQIKMMSGYNAQDHISIPLGSPHRTESVRRVEAQHIKARCRKAAFFQFGTLSRELTLNIVGKKNDYGGQSDGEKRAQFLRDRLQKQLANLGFNNDDVSEKGRCFHSLVHSANE